MARGPCPNPRERRSPTGAATEEALPPLGVGSAWVTAGAHGGPPDRVDTGSREQSGLLTVLLEIRGASVRTAYGQPEQAIWQGINPRTAIAIFVTLRWALVTFRA